MRANFSSSRLGAGRPHPPWRQAAFRPRRDHRAEADGDPWKKARPTWAGSIH